MSRGRHRAAGSVVSTPAGRWPAACYDVAMALGVMTGVDPADAATTTSAGKFETDYTKYLKVGSLKGARIGIARDFMGKDAEIDRVVESSIATLKSSAPPWSIPSSIPTTCSKRSRADLQPARQRRIQGADHRLSEDDRSRLSEDASTKSSRAPTIRHRLQQPRKRRRTEVHRHPSHST